MPKFKFERRGAVDTPPAPLGPIHVVTGAAVDTTRSTYGLVFISSTGRWGLKLGDQERAPIQAAIEDARVRAVAYALERMPATNADVFIHTESEDACKAFQGWQENIPQAIPYLHDLRLPKERRDNYTFVWSPKREEDPLGEWTDSAARLALRIGSGRANRRDAAGLLNTWARARLHDWSHAGRT